MFCSRPFLIFFLSCVILGKFHDHCEPQLVHLLNRFLVQLRLTWNSEFSYYYLPSAGIASMVHYAQLPSLAFWLNSALVSYLVSYIKKNI